VLTEADGGPVAVVVTGANVHDSLLLQDALEAVVVEPPNPMEHEQHLCVGGRSPFPPPLDKAFSGAPSDATARVFGYEPHVRPIGEDKAAAEAARRKGERKGHKPRRWSSGRSRGSTAAAGSWSATRRRRRTTWLSCNWPAPCCGTGGCTGSRLEMVSK
jgi:hypothetical protein